MNKVNLENINDLQKTWLTQISYLNISEEGRNKISNGGLFVYELYEYLEDANAFFAGNAGLNNTFCRESKS